MRITPDLIIQSASFYNALKERELDLRDKKIPSIENLGVTQDQYDSIDFSNNAIPRLESFPTLRRLKSLFFCNNRVYYITPNIGTFLPNVEQLILTNNQLTNLVDLDPLASMPSLVRLSLVDNAVTKRTHYRLYVIHKIPQVRLLDFRKVTQKERAEAKALFSGESGQQLVQKLASEKLAPTAMGSTFSSTPSTVQLTSVRTAIANATTLAEVHQLEQRLAQGGAAAFTAAAPPAPPPASVVPTGPISLPAAGIAPPPVPPPMPVPVAAPPVAAPVAAPVATPVATPVAAPPAVVQPAAPPAPAAAPSSVEKRKRDSDVEMSDAAPVAAAPAAAPKEAVAPKKPKAEVEDLNELRVVDLKERLKARNLEVSGRKADLVARLQAALDAE
eukprot:TRINITY_DN7818_c0_g3_i1.p2 TRINITY_DN7818_c0_g3~~TRINITY_DN7818_c0_g3_i1.p2  ORF type:complete len:388 (+),score=116.27 TRINITY_DN7818_c0_g3_i1:1295-2458(+)